MFPSLSRRKLNCDRKHLHLEGQLSDIIFWFPSILITFHLADHILFSFQSKKEKKHSKSLMHWEIFLKAIVVVHSKWNFDSFPRLLAIGSF